VEIDFEGGEISSEQAILHWVNYHLKKANCKKSIKNLTSDITDSESYAHLLRRIAPDKVSAGKPLKLFSILSVS
jgi:hypothetical protein